MNIGANYSRGIAMEVHSATAGQAPVSARVLGLGFGVWVLRFRVWVLGFRVWVLGFRVGVCLGAMPRSILPPPPDCSPN